MKITNCLFILATLVYSGCCLVAKEVTFGDYELTLNKKPKLTIFAERASLSCKNYQLGSRTFKYERLNTYSFTGKKEILIGIESALEVETSIDTPTSSFKHNIGLHIKAHSSFSSSNSDINTFTETVSKSIERLPCFDIAVLLIHDQEITLVEGMEYEYFNEVVSFKLFKNTDWRIRFEATFNDSCNQCQSRPPHGFVRAVDKSDKLFYVVVETLDGWAYKLPIYRDKQWKLADVTELLPEKAKTLLRAQSDMTR